MPDRPAQDADERRAELRAGWDRSSSGWGRQADNMREQAMPVSAWMLQHADLRSGQRVLELAAGPGDTGFMAAQLIAPGGVLICSDGAEGMLAIARERAAQLGLGNVEFRQLELEWIDLPTADVDVILCRWGLMLALDPAAAVSECRRVLKPGGRLVVAVWDAAERNPAMTVPGSAAVSLGLAAPSPPGGPGPFALSAPGALAELLGDGGFVDPVMETVAVSREYASVREWIGETLDLSGMFRQLWRELNSDARQELISEAAAQVSEFTAVDGSLKLSGRCIVAAADA